MKELDATPGSLSSETPVKGPVGTVMGDTLFFYLGLAVLFPWNVILATSRGYGANINDPAYPSMIPTPYSSACIASLVLMFLIGNKLSIKIKFTLGYGLLAASCLLYIIINMISMDKSTVRFMSIVAASAVGFFGGIAQGSLFSLAGISGVDSYSAYASVGLGSGGLAVSCYELLVNLVLGQEKYERYFNVLMGTTFIVVVGTILAFPVLLRDSAVKTALRSVETSSDNVDESPMLEEEESAIVAEEADVPFTQTIKSMWPVVAAVWFTMFTTFLVFPGMSFKYPTSESVIKGAGLMASFVNFSFQVGDVFGRLSLGWGLAVKDGAPLYIHTAVRVLYVLGGGWGLVGLQMSGSEVLVCLFVLMVGFTTGWLCTMCFVYAPGYIKSQKERAVSGFLTSLGLLVGICTGSAVGSELTKFHFGE